MGTQWPIYDYSKVQTLSGHVAFIGQVENPLHRQKTLIGDMDTMVLSNLKNRLIISHKSRLGQCAHSMQHKFKNEWSSNDMQT